MLHSRDQACSGTVNLLASITLDLENAVGAVARAIKQESLGLFLKNLMQVVFTTAVQ